MFSINMTLGFFSLCANTATTDFRSLQAFLYPNFVLITANDSVLKIMKVRTERFTKWCQSHCRWVGQPEWEATAPASAAVILLCHNTKLFRPPPHFCLWHAGRLWRDGCTHCHSDSRNVRTRTVICSLMDFCFIWKSARHLDARRETSGWKQQTSGCLNVYHIRMQELWASRYLDTNL